MAQGLSVEVLSKAVALILARTQGKTNGWFREWASDYVIPALLEQGIDQKTAMRVRADVYYLAAKVRGIESFSLNVEFAFNKEQLDQVVEQIKNGWK